MAGFPILRISRVQIACGCILLAAFAVRLAVVLHFEEQVASGGGWHGTRFLFPDSLNIHAAARNLAEGRGFVDEAGRFAWRVPGASAWFAFWIALGVDSIGGLRAVQSLLDTVNCILAFVAGARFFNRRAAWVAMAMMAFYPFQIYFSGLVLSETPTITLLLLTLLAQHRLAEKRNLATAILAGLPLGLIALTKASFGPLALLYAAFWLVRGVLDARRWQAQGAGSRFFGAVRIPLFLLLGWGAVLAPWALRNYVLLEAFVPFGNTGGYALYESNSEFADGGPNHGKIVFPPGSDTLGEVERDRALRKAALKWIRKNPGRFARLAVRKFVRTWSPVPNWEAARKPFYMAAMAASYIPVMLLALAGILRMRRSRTMLWILLLPPIHIAVLHMVFMGSIRYRLPVMACFMLLAGAGLDRILPGKNVCD